VLFGVLHVYQGVDLAIAIGLQGLVWGVLYIMRGSVVMSLVSHAGFNAAQVVLAVYAKSLAV
jgi:membrane protease YdiL (CAAX protease family)